jgi:hypothetical protein
MNSDPIKPPLGLRPRIIADHQRAIEVHQALGRALAIRNLQSIPSEWAEELADIINRHQPKD